MKLIPPANEVRKFIVIFYIIGIIGFIIPITKPIFIRLIPLALLMNFGLLVYFHKPLKTKNLLIMLLIAILGFLTEVIGVQTGVIFGSYTYGTALGPKLFETPLMIGINWLILTYCISIILRKKIKSILILSIIGATIVTIFDVIMEPIAIHTGMWNWGNQPIPIQNYTAWFVLSFIFILILRTFSPSNHNKIAGTVFIMQFLFFMALLIVVKLFAA